MEQTVGWDTGATVIDQWLMGTKPGKFHGTDSMEAARMNQT